MLPLTTTLTAIRAAVLYVTEAAARRARGE